MSENEISQSQTIANLSGQNPETAVAQHKLIQLYQELAGRANKIGMLLQYDGIGFIISHAAQKWTGVRKNTLQEVENFLEGAEHAMMSMPKPIANKSA